MLLASHALTHGQTLRSPVCIVGAGPAGIVLALQLADAGTPVLLVESGIARYAPRIQRAADADVDTRRHAPMNEATRRQFGGTSVLWGGRCVPFDPIDFEARDYVPHSGWPVRYAEVAHYFDRACRYAGCAPGVFEAQRALATTQRSIVPGLPDGEVRSSTLERWASPANFATAYRRTLEDHPGITVLLGATCVAVDCADEGDGGDAVTSLTLRTREGATLRATADRYVIACGGLESTRLLLNSDQRHPGGIGNHSGHLGRYYMGHPSGKIADVQFFTPPAQTIYNFEQDAGGVYCRRRFTASESTQREHRLMNCALWLDNPRLADASHGNGVLSFAWLALATPGLNRLLAPKGIVAAVLGTPVPGAALSHLRNCLADAGAVARFVPRFTWQRYFAKRRIPGFFLGSESNRYALHFHAEQAPNRDSRVTLTAERDEYGMRRLAVDLRFTDEDARSIVGHHRVLDAHLRRHNCGRLIYKTHDLEAAVLEQARDGFHQIGTARMAARAEDGVVDPDCRVHGVRNLYVCSSAVFPTSGQANPTLTLLALALRLADHLAPALR